MIRYALTCDCGARFDGWFRSAAGCEAQLRAKAVNCPECGGASVSKALMAPSVSTRAPRAEPPPTEAFPVEAPMAGGPSSGGPTAQALPRASGAARGGDQGAAGRASADPRAALTALRTLRRRIERTAEGVGERFAEEARAIHAGEAEARPIYGDATEAQALALAEDGVPVVRVPWAPLTDD